MIKEIKDIKVINHFLSKFDFTISDLSNPYTHYLGYFFNDKIIGFISFSLIYDKSEIDYIYVEENYRNKKIASSLMQYTIDYLKDKKCQNITLEVRHSNIIAIKFYEKFLFSSVTIRKNYYPNEDAIMMIRELIKNEK